MGLGIGFWVFAKSQSLTSIPTKEEAMKKTIITLICLILATGVLGTAAQKDLEVQGMRLASQKPPFTLTLPSGFNLAPFFLT